MEIEMTIKGLMIDPITSMPIVVLRDREGQRLLPIWVGKSEADGIMIEMEKVRTPRPMTYDLLTNVIGDLGGEVERVVVCDLRENTFYAIIYIRANGRVVEIDARPSDAINVALRTQSKIFVEESVIQSASSVQMSKDAIGDVARVQKWLEELSDDELGKYKM